MRNDTHISKQYWEWCRLVPHSFLRWAHWCTHDNISDHLCSLYLSNLGECMWLELKINAPIHMETHKRYCLEIPSDSSVDIWKIMVALTDQLLAPSNRGGNTAVVKSSSCKRTESAPYVFSFSFVENSPQATLVQFSHSMPKLNHFLTIMKSTRKYIQFLDITELTSPTTTNYHCWKQSNCLLMTETLIVFTWGTHTDYTRISSSTFRKITVILLAHIATNFWPIFRSENHLSAARFCMFLIHHSSFPLLFTNMNHFIWNVYS